MTPTTQLGVVVVLDLSGIGREIEITFGRFLPFCLQKHFGVQNQRFFTLPNVYGLSYLQRLSLQITSFNVYSTIQCNVPLDVLILYLQVRTNQLLTFRTDCDLIFQRFIFFVDFL